MGWTGPIWAPDSLAPPVRCTRDNLLIVVLCSEVGIVGKCRSWATAIRMFDHHLFRGLDGASESALGSVGCLPECLKGGRQRSRERSEHSRPRSGALIVMLVKQYCAWRVRAACQSSASAIFGGSATSVVGDQAHPDHGNRVGGTETDSLEKACGRSSPVGWLRGGYT